MVAEKQYKVIGTRPIRPDGTDKVTGRAQYGADVKMTGMTIQRNGLLKTMLDYGDVVCQTAGTDNDFTIIGVKDPRAVQALVDRERDRERMRIRVG